MTPRDDSEIVQLGRVITRWFDLDNPPGPLTEPTRQAASALRRRTLLNELAST